MTTKAELEVLYASTTCPGCGETSRSYDVNAPDGPTYSCGGCGNPVIPVSYLTTREVPRKADAEIENPTRPVYIKRPADER